MAKYDEKTLARELQHVFKDELLGNSQVPLVIPTFDLGQYQIRLFKTRHHQRFETDYKIPVWKIARATSAAPTYLPTSREIGNAHLIDGGVWANNPIMVAITEAIGEFEISPQNIRVLSLGTSTPVRKRKTYLNSGGLFPWGMNIADVFMQGQSSGTLGQARRIVGGDNIVHIDPLVADGEFKLDKHQPERLEEMADFEARHALPRLRNVFFESEACIGKETLNQVKGGIANVA